MIEHDEDILVRRRLFRESIDNEGEFRGGEDIPVVAADRRLETGQTGSLVYTPIDLIGVDLEKHLAAPVIHRIVQWMSWPNGIVLRHIVVIHAGNIRINDETRIGPSRHRNRCRNE